MFLFSDRCEPKRPCLSTIPGGLRYRLSGWIVGLALLSGRFASGADPQPVETGAEERHARMLALFENVTLSVGAKKPRVATRSPQPVLKYTNPANSSQVYASMFLWFDGTVPVAVVCPSFRDSGQVYWEWTSLTPEPLTLTRDGKTVWQPASAAHIAIELADAPVPATTAPGRLIQMRALARRFQVTEVRRGSPQDARLLTQPVFRWESETTGVIDAAMFGFTETTDPELLLRLEARKVTGSADAVWYFTVARMTSSPLTVLLDEQPVWKAEGYWQNPRTPRDPYIETTIGTFDPKTFFPPPK